MTFTPGPWRWTYPSKGRHVLESADGAEVVRAYNGAGGIPWVAVLNEADEPLLAAALYVDDDPMQAILGACVRALEERNGVPTNG